MPSEVRGASSRPLKLLGGYLLNPEQSFAIGVNRSDIVCLWVGIVVSELCHSPAMVGFLVLLEWL